jgi:hypothetical protein
MELNFIRDDPEAKNGANNMFFAPSPASGRGLGRGKWAYENTFSYIKTPL